MHYCFHCVGWTSSCSRNSRSWISSWDQRRRWQWKYPSSSPALFFIPVFVLIGSILPLQFCFVQHYCQNYNRKLLKQCCPLLDKQALTAAFCVCVCVCFPVPFAFVVLKDGLSDKPASILQELRELVATKIAKYAVPEHFLVRPRPPVTHLTSIMLAPSTKPLFSHALSLRWWSGCQRPALEKSWGGYSGRLPWGQVTLVMCQL